MKFPRDNYEIREAYYDGPTHSSTPAQKKPVVKEKFNQISRQEFILKYKEFLKTQNTPNKFLIDVINDSHEPSKSGRAYPVTLSDPIPQPSLPEPLPDPLAFASGFYFDDDDKDPLGLEDRPVTTPRYLTFAAALPSRGKKDKYDILQIRIPLKFDEENFIVYDETTRGIQFEKIRDDDGRRQALQHIAAFANPGLKDLHNEMQRRLPRHVENDAALLSLLRSIDAEIGNGYRLSDVFDLTRIEDIIHHPDLRDDLPDAFNIQNYNNIENAPPGVIFAAVSSAPSCREKADASPCKFKKMDYIRLVKPEQKQEAAVPALKNQPDFVVKKPGFLTFAFSPDHYRRQMLFALFARDLSMFELKVVSHYFDTKNPLKGVLKLQHESGAEINLHVTWAQDESSAFRRPEWTKIGLKLVDSFNPDLENVVTSYEFPNCRIDKKYIRPIENFARELARAADRVFRGYSYIAQLENGKRLRIRDTAVQSMPREMPSLVKDVGHQFLSEIKVSATSNCRPNLDLS